MCDALASGAGLGLPRSSSSAGLFYGAGRRRVNTSVKRMRVCEVKWPFSLAMARGWRAACSIGGASSIWYGRDHASWISSRRGMGALILITSAEARDTDSRHYTSGVGARIL